MAFLNELEAQLGPGRIKTNVHLAPYTTFKVGGPAEYYFEAQSDDDIVKAIKTAHSLDLSVTIFGGVSNVVISDAGIKGLIIRNQNSSKKIIEETDDSVLLQVSSGYSMTRLAKETADNGWSGLEYHIGLPGTLGGAIYMNSKWYLNLGKERKEVYAGDPLVKAMIVSPNGEATVVDRAYFKFGYDYSILQETKEILLWGQFRLKKVALEISQGHARDSLDYRKATQPMGVPSSGCYFKNVNGESVGKMIDELGLKGHSIGGAQISDKHANFIINTGGATSHDVKQLVEFIKTKVKEKYNIDLEEEVSLM